MQTQNAFVFLYPHENQFDFEIRNYSWSYDFPEVQMEFDARLKAAVSKAEIKKIQEEYLDCTAKLFRPIYSGILNTSIDLRYRKNGFRIFYALLEGNPVSNVISLKSTDNFIYAGIDEKTHRTPNSDGKCPYPDRDFILDQLGNVNRLVVSGFHLNSCVKKTARRAYVRGINVLVDEELTELFGRDIQKPDFDPSKYPSINPTKTMTNPESFERFFRRRARQPWLYQWRL